MVLMYIILKVAVSEVGQCCAKSLSFSVRSSVSAQAAVCLAIYPLSLSFLIYKWGY